MIRLVTLLCAVLIFASASAAQEAAKKKSEARTTGTVNAAGQYELSKDELALDCKKLTGRMQVRILQIRDNAERKQTSAVSRLAQQVVTPIYGGTQRGADPDADYRRDLAMLQAYNRRLAANKCKTFDLDAELKPQPVQHTPRPTDPKQN